MTTLRLTTPDMPNADDWGICWDKYNCLWKVRVFGVTVGSRKSLDAAREIKALWIAGRLL